ncbi:putative Ig domain-containing protein [Candidatus Spongiihabitans sp.]|uniref:putative Ig domain-containing protein n=1 Tax=Candidatus Spongiihabitans sp. TaxID=3101308 RepID=UPI003C6F688E
MTITVNSPVDSTPPPVPVITTTVTITNQPGIDITGTAEADSTIALIHNGTSLPTVTTTPDGNWSVTRTLTEGANVFTVTATDASGNTSDSTESLIITLDTVRPEAPIIAQPDPLLVTINFPTFTGTGEPGSTLTLIQNNNALDPVVIDSDGNWSITNIDLAEGSNVFTATTTDAVGNQSLVSATVTNDLDTIPPPVPAITTTAATVSTASFTLVGTAVDTTSVGVYNKDSFVANANLDTDGNWSITLTLNPGENSLTVTSRDALGNESALSEPVIITLTLAAPSISASVATLTATVDAEITSVTIDPSSGGAVTSYSIDPILSDGLEFDTSTGAISGTPTATADEITYTITATNVTGEDTATVTITVNNPAVPSISASVATLTATVDAEITSVTIASSGGAVTSYSIDSTLSAGLEFDTSTGAISGTPTATADETTYTITATNAGGTATVTVTITVNNPAVPSISASVETLTATVDAEITPVTIDPSGGGAVTSYSIDSTLSDGLEFDTSTGAISGTPTATADETTYTITATNAGGTATVTVTITVNNPAVPSISASVETLTATVDAEITPVTIDPSGGGAVTSYSIDSTLSDGLEFDTSTGAISGTPTATADEITYTITATNAGGTATVTVTITVNNPAVPSISASVATLTATVDAEITPVTIASSGGAVTSYSIDETLSAGLEFDTSTGAISGTPTATADMITYAITATNAGGKDTVTVAITVTSTSTLDGSTNNHTVTAIKSGGSIILTVDPVIPPKATIQVSYTANRGTITYMQGNNDVVAFSNVEVVNLVKAEGEFSDLNNVILPEVARAMADSTVSAIARRIGQAGSATRSVAIGGQSSLAGALSTRGGTATDDLGDFKKMLAGSGFTLPLNAGDGATGGSSLALWGSGEYRNLSSKSGALNWDGDLTGAHLGFDARIANDVLAGLAVSWLNSDLDYKGSALGKGDHEIDLTSVHPYIGWRAGQLDLWATVGYGNGELEITQSGVKNSSDINQRTIGVGGSGQLWQGGASSLRLKGEALQTAMEVKGGVGIDKKDVDATRLRMTVEASQSRVLAGGGGIQRLWEDLPADSDDGAADYSARMDARIGLNWKAGSRFDLNLVGERREPSAAATEHAILLKGEVRF